MEAEAARDAQAEAEVLPSASVVATESAEARPASPLRAAAARLRLEARVAAQSPEARAGEAVADRRAAVAARAGGPKQAQASGWKGGLVDMVSQWLKAL